MLIGSPPSGPDAADILVAEAERPRRQGEAPLVCNAADVGLRAGMVRLECRFSRCTLRPALIGHAVGGANHEI
jgi:hypothetical protein